MSDGLGDRTAVSPAEFSDSPLSRVLRQPFILGLFLPVQSGGWSASLLPRTTDWRFDYNATLTKRAERLGFDLVFGLAQWTSKGGYGGISKYREDLLDPFIAVAALSAITDRILLISTVHVPFGPWHPLHLAKFGATIDHISGGRWGINIVTGYAAVRASDPRQCDGLPGRHPRPAMGRDRGSDAAGQVLVPGQGLHHAEATMPRRIPTSSSSPAPPGTRSTRRLPLSPRTMPS